MSSLVRVKLLQQGFEKYSGMIGDISFLDGVSEQIPMRTADRILAVMSSKIVEGDTRTYFQRQKDLRSISMPIFNAKKEGTFIESPEPVETAPKYTEESLGKIADEGGIVALRDIGDEFGVRSNSIERLIQAILDAQENAKK